MLVFLRILSAALVAHVHRMTSADSIFSRSAVRMFCKYSLRVAASTNSSRWICSSTLRKLAACIVQFITNTTFYDQILVCASQAGAISEPP